jgi:Predicted P-loop-containing kinase
MITLQSFGFKYGRPDANIVFDVSYFINPWRDASIREESEPAFRRKKIFNFMMKQEGVAEFVDKVVSLLSTYENAFKGENFQVAFCCSAGEYRSPAIAELVHMALKEIGINSTLKQSKNSKL